MPKVLEAGPESSVTMPIRSSFGAPATLGEGAWAAARDNTTAITPVTLSAITPRRRVFIKLSQWLVGWNAGRIAGTPVAVNEEDAKTSRYRRRSATDRKSTRLNSSHSQISYAVFCLKK